jgi:hypothetical protein
MTFDVEGSVEDEAVFVSSELSRWPLKSVPCSAVFPLCGVVVPVVFPRARSIEIGFSVSPPSVYDELGVPQDAYTVYRPEVAET